MRPLAGLPTAFGCQRSELTGRIYSWDASDKPSTGLTAHQQANLEDYRGRCFARVSCRKVFMADLSQNWRSRPKTSLATGCLPTLTTTAGWWYDLERRQFYSARELLAMQGLPSSNALALRLCIAPLPWPVLSRAASARLAGNGMHLNCIVSVLLWVRVFGDHVKSSTLVDRVFAQSPPVFVGPSPLPPSPAAGSRAVGRLPDPAAAVLRLRRHHL